jgi:hypothetical protein
MEILERRERRIEWITLSYRFENDEKKEKVERTKKARGNYILECMRERVT